MKGKLRIAAKADKTYTISKAPYSQGLDPANILRQGYSRKEVADYLRDKREWVAEYDDRFFTKVKPGVYEQVEESNPFSDGLLFITEEKEPSDYGVSEEYFEDGE